MKKRKFCCYIDFHCGIQLQMSVQERQHILFEVYIHIWWWLECAFLTCCKILSGPSSAPKLRPGHWLHEYTRTPRCTASGGIPANNSWSSASADAEDGIAASSSPGGSNAAAAGTTEGGCGGDGEAAGGGPRIILRSRTESMSGLNWPLMRSPKVSNQNYIRLLLFCVENYSLITEWILFINLKKKILEYSIKV